MFLILLSFKNIHSWSFYNQFIIVFSALLGLVWWTDRCWMYLGLKPPEISKTLCSNWTLDSPPCFHREATSNSVDVGRFRSHLDRIALSVCFPVTAFLFLKNNSEVVRSCHEIRWCFGECRSLRLAPESDAESQVMCCTSALGLVKMNETHNLLKFK